MKPSTSSPFRLLWHQSTKLCFGGSTIEYVLILTFGLGTYHRLSSRMLFSLLASDSIWLCVRGREPRGRNSISLIALSYSIAVLMPPPWLSPLNGSPTTFEMDLNVLLVWPWMEIEILILRKCLPREGDVQSSILKPLLNAWYWYWVPVIRLFFFLILYLMSLPRRWRCRSFIWYFEGLGYHGFNL